MKTLKKTIMTVKKLWEIIYYHQSLILFQYPVMHSNYLKVFQQIYKFFSPCCKILGRGEGLLVLTQE